MTKGNLNTRARKVARYNPPRDKYANSERGQVYNSGTRAPDVYYNQSKTLSLSLGTVENLEDEKAFVLRPWKTSKNTLRS